MPEKLKTLRKVATIESVGSSTRIEGVKLSDREVEKLLLNLDPDSFDSRDEEEVAGYARACEEIFDNFDAIPFTENSIKQLHGWLLQFSHKDERHRGHYKKLSNNIEAFEMCIRDRKKVIPLCTFYSPMMHYLLWLLPVTNAPKAPTLGRFYTKHRHAKQSTFYNKHLRSTAATKP